MADTKTIAIYCFWPNSTHAVVWLVCLVNIIVMKFVVRELFVLLFLAFVGLLCLRSLLYFTRIVAEFSGQIDQSPRPDVSACALPVAIHDPQQQYYLNYLNLGELCE